ncbi:MAG TPA: phosphatase PAP2 family protein [Candidatus Elarobacter sp.]|nr:phosphatase PAP2 family protein [Candidatus Elarobacter sp.]
MADSFELRLCIVALACVIAAFVFGALVAHRPPTPVDIAAGSLRGHAVPLALFFTSLGRWPVLLGLGVVAAGTAVALRTGLTAVGIVYGAQIASQGANAAVKLLFHRARPDAWLRIHETDLSFPSGHAVTAVVFFVGFAILAWHAPLPRPVAAAIVAALLVCAIGIPWSRLALAAHYFTDVLGGVLLGAAFLCAAFALILRYVSIKSISAG